MKIDVLGTEYTLNIIPKADDKNLTTCDGYVDNTIHKIVISDCATCDVGNIGVQVKEIIRHEIVHAFMFESGLGDSWEHTITGHDETVVDWFALQFPKIMKAMQAADAL